MIFFGGSTRYRAKNMIEFFSEFGRNHAQKSISSIKNGAFLKISNSTPAGRI